MTLRDPRAGNSLAVQRGRDRGDASTLVVQVEDKADDLRFGVINQPTNANAPWFAMLSVLINRVPLVAKRGPAGAVSF
jgi:hypothetical protein